MGSYGDIKKLVKKAVMLQIKKQVLKGQKEGEKKW